MSSTNRQLSNNMPHDPMLLDPLEKNGPKKKMKISIFFPSLLSYGYNTTMGVSLVLTHTYPINMGPIDQNKKKIFKKNIFGGGSVPNPTPPKHEGHKGPYYYHKLHLGICSQ